MVSRGRHDKSEDYNDYAWNYSYSHQKNFGLSTPGLMLMTFIHRRKVASCLVISYKL